MNKMDVHQDVVYARRKGRAAGQQDDFEEGRPGRDGFNFSGESNAGGAPPFDILPLLAAVARKWRSTVVAGLVMGAVGAVLTLTLWHKNYTATAQLVRHESPNTASVLGDRQVSEQTFAGLLRAPDLIQRVSEKSGFLTGSELSANLRIMPERNSEIMTIAITAKTADEAVKAANLYAAEAVAYTQEMQGESAGEIGRYLRHQLTQVNQEIQELNRQWWMVTKSAAAAAVTQSKQENLATIMPMATPARTMQLAGRLEKARDELFDLLTRYTDAHPQVQSQRARIAALEKQVQQQIETAAVAAPPVPSVATTQAVSKAAEAPAVAESETDLDIIRTKLTALENARMGLLSRQNTLQLFEKNSPGNYRVLFPATLAEAVVHDPKLKVIFLSAFACFAGALAMALVIAFREITDEHLKTADDVKRVTNLPVLARLGDVDKMSGAELRNWSFRTWTMLQNRIGMHPNQGLVCGITSSSSEEERAVWMNLLAQAASQCGFKVLTITTKKSPDQGEEQAALPSEVDTHKALTATLESSETALQTANVLASPAEVSQRLTAVDAQPMVHIPLPGWVWNLERRKQWKTALEQWQQIDNVVILVDLPPASSPEAVLLAENLPNLIWLTESGKATATETRTQLETLNNACCNLVGAVMKDNDGKPVKTLFSRWTQTAAA